MAKKWSGKSFSLSSDRSLCNVRAWNGFIWQEACYICYRIIFVNKMAAPRLLGTVEYRREHERSAARGRNILRVEETKERDGDRKERRG